MAAQNAENEGWTKDIPRKGDWYVSGWYFQRRLSNHAQRVVEINQHGYIWHGDNPTTQFVIDLRETGDYEWLGPISPSDATQLVELRKAAQSLLDVIDNADYGLDVYSLAPNLRTAAKKLAAVLIGNDFEVKTDAD